MVKPAIGLIFIALVILLDQISKWFVLEEVFRPALIESGAEISERSIGFFEWIQVPGGLFPPISLPMNDFFNLTMVWNRGISFGFLSDGALLGPMGLVAMAGVIALFFFIWMVRSDLWGEVIALSALIGGALGNIYDRLRFGAVADFLDVHYAGMHFPTFNIADAAISIGIAFLILHGLFSKHE